MLAPFAQNMILNKQVTVKINGGKIAHKRGKKMLKKL
jgi:hypothetical protein